MKVWVFAVVYPDNSYPIVEFYDADKLTDKQREVLLMCDTDVRYQATDINEVFTEQLGMEEDNTWNDVLSDAYIPNISGKKVEIEQTISIVLY